MMRLIQALQLTRVGTPILCVSGDGQLKVSCLYVILYIVFKRKVLHLFFDISFTVLGQIS